jgi:hypothetical protein
VPGRLAQPHTDGEVDVGQERRQLSGELSVSLRLVAGFRRHRVSHQKRRGDAERVKVLARARRAGS